MTYSRRQFLPLSMNNSNNNSNNTSQSQSQSHSQPHSQSHSQSPYRFWKFIDQRDPRHHRFVTSGSLSDDSDAEPLTGTDWCLLDNGSDSDSNRNRNNNKTVAVLYIPGHGGSYEQSRSLGAHGLQLTGARDMRQQRRVISALQRNEWSGATDNDNDPDNIDTFIFDVYAVDFGEEGGALHGDLILEQGLFVGQAVRKLVQDCHLQSIVLVGHSMGGFAARLASILVPETRPYIRNIVTLATPHAGAWNPSLFHIHEHMDKDSDIDIDTTVQQNTALISIAGGLRDEMILPEACHVNGVGATTVRTGMQP
jgi:pimeloyl-ACP methyl ester carboxylesterase